MNPQSANEWNAFLPDEAATIHLGQALAASLTPGLNLWLLGELGAGKTTLVRALLHALGHAGAVRSPTYTLVEPYNLPKFAVYHFDFYRFSDPDEFLDAGLDEHFSDDTVCLVEWPQQAAGVVPPPDLRIELVYQGDGRNVRICADSARGAACLSRLLACADLPTAAV